MDVNVRLVGVEVDKDRVMSEVRGRKMGMAAATEWLRLYRKYMPYEPRATTIEPWRIIHQEPYSRYDYEGNVMGPNVPINGGEAWFSPIAPKFLTGTRLRFAKGSDHWDQKAIPTQRQALCDALNAFIKDGGILG